ncbi:MAG: HDIG domain-containing protein [Candidatus Thermoplasmatota archaeon]|nr:HDIG domain-containing protein [Candidatus Thermoplasmatota archaeon]
MPDRDECLRLLREHGCDKEVIAHSEAVTDLALRIAKKCRADMALVQAGALLHDIGRSKTHSISHAVEGAKLARELKLPDAICKIIERHVGAGITAKEANEIGLPKKDYTPRTLEEKIVAHSDNLFSGSRRTSIEEAVSHLARKGHHEAALKVLRLHEELSEKCGTNVDWL